MAGSKDKLGFEQLTKYRWEAIQQPAWRLDAQVNEDYYDGNQLNSEALQTMEERGIPPVVVNLVAPTIDLILGMEVRGRTDWVCRPAGEDWDDVALALSKEVKEAERMTDADEECGEAYADQVRAGIGWVEVSRSPDPFRYQYRIKRRDWREFWWDPRSEEPDLSDARYLLRRRFYDRDHLEKVFPHKAKQIRELGPYYTGEEVDGRRLFEADLYSRGGEHYRDYTTTELDWIDLDRNRLQLEEVWYRDWHHVDVITTSDQRVIEFQKDNPLHIAAVQRGITAVKRGVVAKARRAFWIGGLCIDDRPTPFNHNDFPYIPFWGYREGRTRVPYGIIRRMRPLQDEVNARRSKMLWGLSASRVIADRDAVDDHERTRMEAARRDAYIVTNPERRNAQGFRVDDNQSLNSEQFQVYQDSKQTLQDAGGIYQSMLGKGESGADSGKAIQSLVEQGTTTLAKINGNYRQAKNRVGKLLMSLIVEDLKGRQKQVTVDSPNGRRVVKLNEPEEKEGQRVLNNDVTRANVTVAVDEVPQSATFRAQQYQQMAEMVKRLPPDLQAPLLDMVIEASDLPQREKIADRIRQLTGVGKSAEEMTDEERAQAEQKAQKAQEKEQMATELERARIAKEQGDARYSAARAEKEAAEAQQTTAETQQLPLEAEHTQAETEQTRAETAQKLRELQQPPPEEEEELLYRWQ
ncbi:portal protein [Algiphilus aromaticivorans]|uniref:portal protein n=1 Tax=Algiphilus aromaticivorans TaxID=382454 RepID=UPI0005C1E0EE|nr:hypothetical protein [Algiphilus aromaticivorans]